MKKWIVIGLVLLSVTQGLVGNKCDDKLLQTLCACKNIHVGNQIIFQDFCDKSQFALGAEECRLKEVRGVVEYSSNVDPVLPTEDTIPLRSSFVTYGNPSMVIKSGCGFFTGDVEGYVFGIFLSGTGGFFIIQNSFTINLCKPCKCLPTVGVSKSDLNPNLQFSNGDCILFPSYVLVTNRTKSSVTISHIVNGIFVDGVDPNVLSNCVKQVLTNTQFHFVVQCTAL